MTKKHGLSVLKIVKWIIPSVFFIWLFGLLLIVGIPLLLGFRGIGVAVYLDYPYGVWQSEEPTITLIIDPNYMLDEGRARFPGIYVRDTRTEDVLVGVDPVGAGIEVRNASIEDGRQYAYYAGTYRIRGNRIYFTLGRLWRERTGIDLIVFELVEEVVVPER